MKPRGYLPAWNRSKFESIFLFDLPLHYWFHINPQISSEWECAFLNAAIIVFWLMHSLKIPNSKQNPWFFSVKGSVSISLKLAFRQHSKMSRKKNLHSFSFDFTIAMGAGLVSGFGGKYKVHSLFIVSRYWT